MGRTTSKIKTRHLAPQYIKDEPDCVRSDIDWKDVPCPFCCKLIPDHAGERGLVGPKPYKITKTANGIASAGFSVSPCPDPDCIEKQLARQKRLEEQAEPELYHLTTKDIAAKI